MENMVPSDHQDRKAKRASLACKDRLETAASWAHLVLRVTPVLLDSQVPTESPANKALKGIPERMAKMVKWEMLDQLDHQVLQDKWDCQEPQESPAQKAPVVPKGHLVSPEKREIEGSQDHEDRMDQQDHKGCLVPKAYQDYEVLLDLREKWVYPARRAHQDRLDSKAGAESKDKKAPEAELARKDIADKLEEQESKETSVKRENLECLVPKDLGVSRESRARSDYLATKAMMDQLDCRDLVVLWDQRESPVPQDPKEKRVPMVPPACPVPPESSLSFPLNCCSSATSPSFPPIADGSPGRPIGEGGRDGSATGKIATLLPTLLAEALSTALTKMIWTASCWTCTPTSTRCGRTWIG